MLRGRGFRALLGAMSDFATALGRIREHGDGFLADAAEMLRQLVRDTCEVISAAEGSILVPSEDQTELRFLVSINPTLDPSEISVPVDGSVSGYVFSSRQAMAKVRPENVAVSKVDGISRTETKYLLAVPIVDDDGVYGVATFVNRTGEAADTPFSADDLKTAEVFGEIYATGVKLYRRIDLGTGVARMEIAEHAREFDLEAFGEDGFDEEQALRYRLPSRIAEKSAALPTREREFLLAMVDLLEEYAEREDETETGGP